MPDYPLHETKFGVKASRKVPVREVAVLASCVLCAVCYDDRLQPTFCQELKIVINPRDLASNELRACDCPHFSPHGFPRWAVVMKEQQHG